MKRYYLGIDTSCYTTSCALIDEERNIVAEARKILDVEVGEKGLQQSNMVFQHTKVFPSLLESLPQVPIAGIGVSAFPRRSEESYMPAFLVGQGFGRSLSHMLNVPLYEFSHQENHILAALRHIKELPKDSFFSLHLSGGTTDLIMSQYVGKGAFESTLLGGSNDLQGGQFIDRVGVAMGLQFPAGRALEHLALNADDYEPLPSSVKEGWISFAGPCSEALRRIENGVLSKENISKAVFSSIGNSLEKLITYHYNNHPVTTLIAVGGVMSNSLLRERLYRVCRKYNINVYFADPYFSVDNATGNAFGALLAHRESQ